MADQNPPQPADQNPFGDMSGAFGGPAPTDQSNQGQQPPQPAPEDNTPANFQLGTLLPKQLSITIPPHSLHFDEQKFLHLLAGSISLSRDEKKNIIATIPKLKQSQIDELIRIFEEEREKFAQLNAKHVPQLEKLAKQHYQDWMDLEASVKADAKAANDQSQADEIRKSLGL